MKESTKVPSPRGVSPKKTLSKSSSPTSQKKKASEQVLDVLIPPLLGSNANGECTVMIQMDPADSATLDFEGVSGAIGRFEADNQGVVLDLKGCKYQGKILPGPTAFVMGLSKGGQLKVEGITDEFSRLVKTQDVMAKLDAVVQGEMDDGFVLREEDVNALRTQQQRGDTKQEDSKKTGAGRESKGPTDGNLRKRKSSSSNQVSSAKKQRKSSK